MRPFEIHNVDRVWRNCADQRPYVIVDVRAGGVFGCFSISGQCYAGDCFHIAHDHPDFPATGLSKSCFVHYALVIEVKAAEFRRARGRISGQMLGDFIREAGL
ncbi:MAG: hypothetical protein NTW19_21105 [Planctomycetota bacterium]|nr:hypothetical protein [Planctomycetota bacterium]